MSQQKAYDSRDKYLKYNITPYNTPSLPSSGVVHLPGLCFKTSLTKGSSKSSYTLSGGNYRKTQAATWRKCVLLAGKQICREAFDVLNRAPHIILETQDGSVWNDAEMRRRKFVLACQSWRKPAVVQQYSFGENQQWYSSTVLTKTSSGTAVQPNFPYTFRKRTIL